MVRLFHSEEAKYLTADTLPGPGGDVDAVFLRVSNQTNKMDATSSRGLWEVEVEGFPRTCGALGR